MIHYITKSLPTNDLYLNQYGYESCSPGHFFGPAIRDYYLIHYITSGKGIFKVGKDEYHLEKGQGFLICPDAVTFYQADLSEPWHYYWIGFNGIQVKSLLKQANLSQEKPIFNYTKNDLLQKQFEQICQVKHVNKTEELACLAHLYMLMSLIVDCQIGQDSIKTGENKREEYVKQVIDFIDINYASKITITKIASIIGLNRSYLSSVFKEQTKISIQEYLIKYRITVAKELLHKRELTIGDVSRSVGYDDPLLFSKIFKKVNGVSPLNFRKQMNSR